MLQTFNNNYAKIIKKLPQQMWKTAYYTVLAVTWSAIIVGTFLLLK